MIFVVAGIAILLTMGMALVRIMAGPTLHDRILATNVFGTKTVLIIAVIGFLSGRPEFIDVAIVYALINFIGIVAVLKFFESGSLRRQTRTSDPISPAGSEPYPVSTSVGDSNQITTQPTSPIPTDSISPAGSQSQPMPPSVGDSDHTTPTTSPTPGSSGTGDSVPLDSGSGDSGSGDSGSVDSAPGDSAPRDFLGSGESVPGNSGSLDSAPADADPRRGR